MGSYLFLLLIVVCPLMMFFMMRGMHGGNVDGGHAQRHAGEGGHSHGNTKHSLEELRRQREQLDGEIEQRAVEEETPTPVRGGRR